MLQEVLSLVAAAGVLVFLQRKASWRRRSKGYPLPPSRRGLPLLGNLKDLAASLGREWDAYIEWGKELGSDIVYAKGMGQSIVILNTKELAVHLLEVKSSVFSSRFSSNMIKHMGWGWTLPGYPYGEGFRYRRKLFQKYFHPGDNKLHGERSAQFLHRSLLAMLQHPSDIQAINKELVSGITCSLAYGIDIVKQPYYLEMFEDAILPLVTAAVPGRFMIDFFPWLKYVPEWMPGAGWQRNATIWREKQVNFVEDPCKEALNLLATSESAPTSFVSLALEQNNGADDKFHHTQVVKEIASAFYSAGSETTISVLNFLFLALTIYPEVQKKVQHELDALLSEGNHIRLPTASDADHLPYLKAVIKEIQRWQPVAPIGVPHLSTEDYVHDGYFIPKGSILISNIWAMQRDADLYPDPDSFKPERFLNPDGSFNESMTDPEDVAFGFGRRVCPGKHIALSTLFITASTVLLLFDVCKAKDENGNEITPTMDVATGITRTPKPYKCELKPRSEAARALIESLQSD